MFFGWDKVSKGFHLLSTWLVAIGSNLSAFWILVANGWMQYPVGMKFNIDTVRNEMVNFWDVALSPVAISKFLHTVGSGYVIGALFVVGISAWYLLKKREVAFAKSSMLVGATFGLIVSIFLALSGDESAHQVALKQPVKLAAMEGLYEGKEAASIVAIGVLNSKKTIDNNEKTFHFELEIPYALSLLSYHNSNAFVPGLKDLVYGNEKYNIESAKEKILKGKIALEAFKQYKKYIKEGNTKKANDAKFVLESYINYFGYGYLTEPKDIIPPISLTFYSFHLMVTLGGWFILLFAVVLFLLLKKDITKQRFWLYASMYSIPLGYIAAEAGWIVAEVGRQPWAIQDLMPVGIAATNIATANVQITFWLFAILFTALLIAELKIMAKQIKIGPNGGH